MLTVWLMLLILGFTLTAVLWVGTMFFQGYIYTEPTQGIRWQAPAAGAALTAFYALWCILLINAGSTPGNIPYDTLFNFSAKEDLSPEPLKELVAIVDKKVKEGDKPLRTENVRYVRKRDNAGKVYYAEATGAHRPWNPADVKAISVKYNGQSYYFEEVKAERGKYREFVDKDGWVLVEYETGPTGRATAFRLGRFLINMFLNFNHFAVWFLCLWLILRFQWSHALGLAAVMWLIMSLAILPMMFEQAARVNVPESARTASLFLWPRTFDP